MYTKIFQIGFRNHRTDSIWHTADTELETGTIRNFFYDQFGNCLIDIGSSSAAAHFTDWWVIAFYDHINLGNMNAILKAAKTARHIFIHLDNDHFCTFAAGSQMGSTRTETEISMFIHRRYLKDFYTGRTAQITIITWKFRITDRRVERKSLCNGFSFNASHMPGVPCHMSRRIFNLENFRNPH